MSNIAEILRELENLKKAIRPIQNKQIFSKPICGSLHAVATNYFANVRSTLPSGDKDVAGADALFSQLHDLSRKSPSKQKCLDALTEARKILVRLEGANLARPGEQATGVMAHSDEEILATLDEVCPPAAASYRQALVDLAGAERTSWRGTATDLREALRETLDKLAPDDDVKAMPNFKPEPDAKGPTMKQKTRFILRSRDIRSGQITTSEDAVRHIEDSLGGITRSVYSRSSTSTHTPTTRAEVASLHAWVRLVLCELLALKAR